MTWQRAALSRRRRHVPAQPQGPAGAARPRTAVSGFSAAVGRAACAFARDRLGATAVVVAIAAPVLIGFLGLGAEASFWFYTQRKLQNAADGGAFAGAVQLRAERPASVIRSAATAAAAVSGYKQAIGVATVNAPPTNGAYSGDDTAVEVVLVETLPRTLSAILSDGTVSIRARAVAALTPGRPICVLALDPSAEGAITVTGTTDVTLTGCDISTNSVHPNAFQMTGSADLETPCVSSVGGVSATSGLVLTDCPQPIENAPVAPDPYAALPEPSLTMPCQPAIEFAGPPGSSYVAVPDRYCGGMTIKRNVTMSPGVYIIDGGEFRVESTADLQGSGVTIFLTNGATINVAGTASTNLSAPTSGVYAGVLIFGDPDNPLDDNVFNGDATSIWTGAIYLPSARAVFEGSNSAAGGCTQVVALQIRLAGTSGFGTNCTGVGTADLRSGARIAIVE